MNPELIASICHDANRAYCAAIGDHSQLYWADAPDYQRSNAVRLVKGLLDGSITHPQWQTAYFPSVESPGEQQRKDALFFAIVNALKD